MKYPLHIVANSIIPQYIVVIAH